MEFTEVLENLNKQTNNEFGFILGDTQLHDNVYSLEIKYKDGTILNQDKRNELQIFLLNNLPQGFIYNIKFAKNFKTKEVIISSTKQIIEKNFPALIYNLKECSETENRVILEIDENNFEYAENKQVKKFLEEELAKNFLCEFSVDLVKVATKIDDEDLIDDIFIAPEESKHQIKIQDVTAFCGDKIATIPGYIGDLTVATPNVTVCGKIKFISSKTYQSKKDKEKEAKKAEEQAKTSQETENQVSEQDADIEPVQEKAYEKKFFKFVLEDFSGQLSCLYFSTKQTIANAETLQDGSEIVVLGDYVEDSFTGGYILKVKAINLCVLPKDFKEEIVFKDEPEKYTWCFPEPYIEKKQVDLFSVLSGETETSEYLKTNDVVVFDFETTGLSATDCKIIEIGAVKIHDGKITEQFETFINPMEHIDDESTLVHGITDDMVKDAPTYQQALQDFYKFTRNSTLVAYNIAFDYSFLDLYGKKSCYNFNNPQIDALKLASINVKGVKNYKLKTIADKLGVVLDNAHRAVYDAIATAEVFIKLSQYITPELIK